MAESPVIWRGSDDPWKGRQPRYEKLVYHAPRSFLLVTKLPPVARSRSRSPLSNGSSVASLPKPARTNGPNSLQRQFAVDETARPLRVDAVAETPQPAQLVAAIEREHGGRDVAERLEAALRVAAELRAVGDDVVDHYVQAARGDGRSWAEIGEVLGITKQGAQKRFASPAAAPAEPWPRGFGRDAQAVFAQAVAEARGFGHRYVGTEHLLLALFSERAGLAADCLARLGISRPHVEERVIEFIGRGNTPPDSTLGITPRTKRVFERARRESRRLGHRCPQPEHLLLALYAAPGAVAVDILTASGASEQRTRATLAELLDAQAPELAERIWHRPRRRLARR
jgi:hypothetical protein